MLSLRDGDLVRLGWPSQPSDTIIIRPNVKGIPNNSLCPGSVRPSGVSGIPVISSCVLTVKLLCELSPTLASVISQLISGRSSPTQTIMSVHLISILSLCSCALAVLVSYFRRKNSYNMNLPPGSAGQLLLGNLLQIPAAEPWKLFKEWSKKYGESCFVFVWSAFKQHWYGAITNKGDVILVRLPIQPTIILCSAQAVFDLLDKRSNIYSDRPRSVMDQLYEDLSDL